MSLPLLRQALIFSPDATSQSSLAYFPAVLNGQYVEWTVYIEFSAASSAGKVQIQTAFYANPDITYGGTWANVGSSIDWAANTSQKYASVTGVFDYLRLNITTAVTSGTVSAYVVAQAL